MQRFWILSTVPLLVHIHPSSASLSAGPVSTLHSNHASDIAVPPTRQFFAPCTFTHQHGNSYFFGMVFLRLNVLDQVGLRTNGLLYKAPDPTTTNCRCSKSLCCGLHSTNPQSHDILPSATFIPHLLTGRLNFICDTSSNTTTKSLNKCCNLLIR